MTEQKDPKKSAVTASPATEKKESGTPPKKKSSPRPDKKKKTGSGGVGLAFIALLIAAGSGAASYYLWKLQLITEQQLIQQHNQNVTELKQQLSTSQQQLQSVQRQGEQNNSELSGNLRALEQSLSIVRSQLGANRNDWTIAETEYLLTIANRTLLLTGNGDIAITALEMANDSLANQADPALLPAREQITAEIHALKSVIRPDVETIALQLSALIDAVAQLPIVGTNGPSPANDFKKDDTPTEGNTLQTAGHTLLQALKSLVIIRHDAENTQPLMAPEQRLFLRQNLQLKLESARLALLQRNPAVYRALLIEAAQWIKSYYDDREGSVASTLDEVERLAAINIAPPLPDISASLRLIREMKHRYPSAGSTGSATP